MDRYDKKIAKIYEVFSNPERLNLLYNIDWIRTTETAELLELSRENRRTTFRSLAKMVKQGLLSRPSKGEYMLTELGRQMKNQHCSLCLYIRSHKRI